MKSDRRPARNKFEVDYLPPYGKPEVTITGEAATYAGVLFGIGILLKQLNR